MTTHSSFTTPSGFRNPNPRVKLLWVLPRFLLGNKNNKPVIRFAVVLSFLWHFCNCLFLTIRNSVMVDSPIFYGPRD